MVPAQGPGMATNAPDSSRPALTRTEELALLERLLSADRSAWNDFNTAYGRLVRTTIGRVIGRFGLSASSEDAREIHSVFCLDILSNDKQKLRAFSPERGVRLSTWVAMLASHTAYDFLRRRRRD